MSDSTPDGLHVARPHPVGSNGRPIRKDEIEIPERGLYVESWMPERRSRRRPLLFVHGELTGSWVWERYLSYFASRGWEATPSTCGTTAGPRPPTWPPPTSRRMSRT